MSSEEASTRQRPYRFRVPAARKEPLVGREKILEELRSRLRAGDDLALWSGLPGAGKTALAHALARDPAVEEDFGDYILWTSLGPSPDIKYRLTEWAICLGKTKAELELRNTRELHDTVTDAIGDQAVLVVIDDAWDEDDAAAFKVGGARTSRIVTTRLKDVARHFAPHGVVLVKDLSPDGAYALMEQLAPTFVARDPDAARKCATAAAGLPLAVTLIASHLEVEADSPKAEFEAAIQRVLEQRAWLLDEELSEFDFSLRSLRNAIALSYDRLDSPARGALSYLSVFPPKTNTFSREAADRISGTEVAMPTLRRSGLVELINVEPERYTMHQAIAEFAEEARDDETAYGRMAEYFIEYAAARRKSSTTTSEWLECIAEETRNIGEALDWTVRTGHVKLGLNLASALNEYWYERSFFEHGQRWIDKLLSLEAGDEALNLTKALAACDDTLLIAKALNDSGNYAYSRGDLNEALRRYERSRDLRREADDEQAVAGSLNNIALVLRDRGEYPQAEALLDEAHAINVRTENVDWQGRNLNNLGLCATMQHEGEKGRDLQCQAIECFRLARSDWGIAMAKGDLGHAYRVLSQPDAARSALAESLSLRVGIRDLKGIAAALHGLGQLDLDEGDAARGEDRLKPALHIAMRIGDSGRIALLLQSFARIAGEGGDHAASLRYLEAAAAYRRWNRSEDPPIVRPRLEALREAARNAGVSAPDSDGDQAVMNLADVALEALAGDTRSVDEIVNALAA